MASIDPARTDPSEPDPPLATPRGNALAAPRRGIRATTPAASESRFSELSETVRETVKETVGPVVQRRPVRLVRRTLSKAWHDRVLGLSAEAAFWQLLSLPPLLLAVLGSLGYLADLVGQHTIDTVESNLIDAFGRAFTPEVVRDVIQPMFDELLSRGRADVISIGFAISLWAGSSAMATFVNTITIAYNMRDMRGAVRSRLIALWLYVASLGVGLVILPLMVLGPRQVVDLFPEDMRGDVNHLIQALYWPTVGGVLLLGLTSLYHLAVPKRLPWHRGLPGALLAMAIALLGGYGVRDYISVVVDNAFTYGRLAAPIAVLLFMFVLALAVLVGAELNATIEEMWPSAPGWRGRRGRRRAARSSARDQAAQAAQAGQIAQAAQAGHVGGAGQVGRHPAAEDGDGAVRGTPAADEAGQA